MSRQWFYFIHHYPLLASGGSALALPKPALDGMEASLFGMCVAQSYGN